MVNPSRIYTTLLALAVAACQPDLILPSEERGPFIDEEVQVYVDRFVEEAENRGVELDISRLQIRVQGSIQPIEAAGACHYFTEDDAPFIVIDTTSLNWRHQDHTREMLVFHELAHCLLGREHDDSMFPNGNYASMMRSDKGVVYGADSYKRAYYLDELFNPGQAPPAWAQAPSTLSFEEENGTILFEDNFQDNSQDWTLGSSPNSIRKIGEQGFLIESLGNGAIFSGKHIPLPVAANFEVSVQVRIKEGDRPVLLQWGGDHPGSMYYLGYGREQFAMLGHTSQGLMGGRTVKEIQPGGINDLTIRKEGETYSFFINGELFDTSILPPYQGDLWGFYVGSLSKIEVSHFSIRTYE